MTVYLAGPITGLSYESATGWRRKVADALPMHEVLDPMRGKEDLAGASLLAAGLCTTEMAQRDLADIDRCDVVLVNFQGARQMSVGTVAEIGYAFGRSKKVMVVFDDLHAHPFLMAMVRWTPWSLEEAIDRLAGMQG